MNTALLVCLYLWNKRTKPYYDMEMKIKILWADDEIDLLKPHILFLRQKNYLVTPVNSGVEAIEKAKSEAFDIIFLDEQMPGINGLEALQEIKSFRPDTPIVMITKSEEENIMEAAIGSHIADYLIKPVNPNQILLSLKKNLNHRDLVSQKTTSDYQADFARLSMDISNADSWDSWRSIYKKLTRWDLQLSESTYSDMKDVLSMQWTEANSQFSRYIKNSYEEWFAGADEKPLMTPDIVKQKVVPSLKDGEKVTLLVIDNLRLDQWWLIRPIIKEFFSIESEELCSAILPTTTQYSRNALFAGLMPGTIAERYPQYWKSDEEEGSKNEHEEALLQEQLKRYGYRDKFFFEKFAATGSGRKIQEKYNSIRNHQLSVVVYNFVDTLSHARTEMEVIKELASDEAAYRSLTLSWFKHSPLFDLIRHLSENKTRLIIATDHGSVKGITPVKVSGDKTITTNLRYKSGRMLKYNSKEVFEVADPKLVGLPKNHLSTSYIFAMKNDFFAYPNNYNYYAKYYRDTFQHGGISMEEMIIPLVTLVSN